MHHTNLIYPVELVAVMLMISAAVAMAVKWIKIPYSIGLVAIGLIISLTHVLPQISMTPDLILVVFLPALLFEASWNLKLDELKRNWISVGALSTIGVLISMLVIGACLKFFGQMGTTTALMLGAIVSATDPISVLAIFKKLGVSKRLSTIMEAESLFNDGTAVTLFQIMLLVILSGSASSVPIALGNFLVIFGGGIATGLVIGLASCKLISWFDDHLLELMLTTLVAYGASLVAYQINVSPVMAVVTASILLGSFKKHSVMSESTRIAITTFWEFAAFIVNSLVFLLIGLQINLSLLAKYAELIGISILGLLLSRLIIAYVLIQFTSIKEAPIPLGWRHLLFWGALRGSLSMALALSLPINFPQREELIVITFAVVLFTLMAQGLTLEPLVKLLYKNKLLEKIV
jgi:CPA1 family monovalent cation:H+ antiporter